MVKTEIHEAAKNGDNELIKKLAKGLSVNEEDEDGRTPMHFAAFHHYVETCKILKGLGAVADMGDKYGRTAMHYAILSNCDACPNDYIKICSALQLLGFSIDAKDEDGRTPMHLTAKTQDFCKCCVALKNLGANVNEKDKDGKSPLHVAAENCKVLACKTLKDIGADIEMKDKFGMTPLHLAKGAKVSKLQWQIETCEYLLRIGANDAALDNAGRTPLDLAKANNQKTGGDECNCGENCGRGNDSNKTCLCRNENCKCKSCKDTSSSPKHRKKQEKVIIYPTR